MFDPFARCFTFNRNEDNAIDHMGQDQDLGKTLVRRAVKDDAIVTLGGEGQKFVIDALAGIEHGTPTLELRTQISPI